jgi:hypothetical protein
MVIGNLRCLRVLRIEHNGNPYAVGKGDDWLFPAEAGEGAFHESPRPFRHSAIDHQRCQIIWLASSGTSAPGWRGTIRAV